jgi:hypothetical protein
MTGKLKKIRGLSDVFIRDLKSEILSPLLSAVHADATLCLQIRDESINIYYRGGSLLRVSRDKRGLYIPWFDLRYFLNKAPSAVQELCHTTINSKPGARKWVVLFPCLKHAMDLWFGKHPKEEREYQQLVVRENNFGKCGGKTDYIICDIEYAKASDRFDMVAVFWPSSGAERKQTDNMAISFIEMKYADSALTGISGLDKHINGMAGFLSNPEPLKAIKGEMMNVFNQMIDLGLIIVKRKMTAFGNRKPEFILLLANHDPDSKILRRELANIRGSAEKLPFELKFVTSNFMGYGLYRQNVYGLEEFLTRFQRQI